jgi:hypothetical protein
MLFLLFITFNINAIKCLEATRFKIFFELDQHADKGVWIQCEANTLPTELSWVMLQGLKFMCQTSKLKFEVTELKPCIKNDRSQ